MRQVGDGVHCVDGWWKQSPMGRRMTVLELGDGELAIHCSIRMDGPDMEKLDALGRVAYVIAPNPFHASEAPWYAERYPEAKVLIPRGMREKQEPRMRIDGSVEEWPAALGGRLEACTIEGLRIAESAYFHPRSRTLVVTDLVMNFGGDHFKGPIKLLMHLNGIVGRFATSRLFRSAIKDKARFRQSLQRLMEWDFDRVVMSHGRVLESGGRERLGTALGFVLP
jgi:hypothetical protein